MAASPGGPAIAQAAEAGLALAWNMAEGRLQPEAEQVVSDLLSIIERASSDEGRPEALAAHAVDLVVFVLEAASGPTPTVGLRLLAEEGWTWPEKRTSPWRIRRSRPRWVLGTDDEEPHGSLVTQEIEAQRASIRLLDVGDRSDAQAVEAVRRLSKAQAAELARVMSEFAQRYSRGSP